MTVLNAKNQAPQLELVKVDSLPANVIPFSKFDVIELWRNGILSNTAFVAIALRFDRDRIEETGKIDIDFFVQHWDAGDKTLTEEQLLKALATLQKKEVVQLGDRQLSLTLLG